MRTTRAKLLGSFLVVAAAITVLAGTLDNAPFRVVLAGKDWKLNDATILPKGNGVYVIGVLTNSQTRVWLRIAKTEFAESPAKSLDDICAGVRESFAAPSVKVVADEEVTFLGHKARRFAFQNKHVNRPTTYEEAVIFAAGTTGWTINTIGLLNQTNQVRQAYTMFQKK